LRELELREKEMNAKMEVELKEKELPLRKEKVKEKELQMQLKLKEFEAKTVERPPITEKKDASFDVSHQVRLVPPFQEQEVDKFSCTLKKLLPTYIGQ